MRRAPILLALLLAACNNDNNANVDAGPDGCVTDVDPGDFRVTRADAGAPPGPPNFRQQIRVMGCQGLQFYWVDTDGGTFWRELVTNCAPDGTTFPCLRDIAGNGGPSANPTSEYQRRCVCCLAGRCTGFLCPTLANADGGTPPCAPEDPAFQTSGDGGTPIPEPRTQLPICDCAAVM
jgi:hypothetical protein